MNKSLKYGLLVWLLIIQLISGPAAAQPERPGLGLFPDRSWAVSGDTVWFAVTNYSPDLIRGNVVHVQLESPSGELVSQVMVVTSEGKGEGYLPVPDSLSSGFYWLRAFTNTMRNSASFMVPGRLLTVYHRFAEQIFSIPGPGELKFQEWANLNEVDLMMNTDQVKPRDLIRAEIRIPETARQKIREMIVTASLGEPSDPLPGRFFTTIPDSSHSDKREDFTAEQNGFFLEGKVIPAPGNKLPERSLVLLSIPDSIPYFDYCFAGSDGYFRFNLKNAYGTAELYIRAIAAEREVLTVEVLKGLVTARRGIHSTSRELNEPGQRFVKEMLEAEGYKRIFTPEKNVAEPVFFMKSRSSVAFYGIPDHRVIPSEFINLPDFLEISRELLPAAKFRRHEGQFSLQIFDDLEHKYFENSPLRLINGVPVFDDNLFFRLKSTDIRTIDLVYQERIFGDISFKGVIAIVLNGNAGDWLSEQKNLCRFTIPCLQIPQTPVNKVYSDPPPGNHIPDFRRVFLFRRLGTEETQSFSFRVSDLKGTVVVKIEGFTHDNQPFVLTREILVR